MKLVVLIPAFNEEKTISTVVERIPRKILGISAIEALVVDDGSTDSTVALAKKSGARVHSNGMNRGLGTSFATGINEALKSGADIIVNIDADGQFNPEDIPKLISPIMGKKADIVTCSRFLDKNLEPAIPFVKKWGNRFFTKLVNFFTGGKFTDTQCGFRAYSREAALRLTVFGEFTYTQEVFLDLASKKMRIAEVALPVRAERQFGKSKMVSNVLTYGVRAIAIILRSVRDYQPLKFFGSMGALALLASFATGAFVFQHWLVTGHTSPYRSLLDTSLFFLLIGGILVVLALIADMSDRQRKLQEEILYYLKKESFKKN